MVKQRTLTPSFLVRVQVPQLGKRLTKVGRFCFKWRVLGLRRMSEGICIQFLTLIITIYSSFTYFS